MKINNSIIYYKRLELWLQDIANQISEGLRKFNRLKLIYVVIISFMSMFLSDDPDTGIYNLI